MKRTAGFVGLFAGGLVAGAVIMGLVAWNMMPGMMLTVHESQFGFDETVEFVTASATKHGWQVPKIYDLQASLVKAGHDDMTRVKVLSLCQPDHAYGVLHHDENKKITAIMPCRVGVYEDASGKVYISEMNMGLMSRMFGGSIAEVMGKVAEEEHEMMKGAFGDQSAAPAQPTPVAAR